MMKKILSTLLLTAASLPAFAQSLLSDAEYANEMNARKRSGSETELVMKSVPVPGAPAIEVKKPQTSDVLKSPFPIQIQFTANGDAQVVPESLKVLYGVLKLDITDRVVKRAALTKEGLSVEQANIPAGTHKLLLQIQDTKNRKSEMALNFTVE